MSRHEIPTGHGDRSGLSSESPWHRAKSLARRKMGHRIGICTPVLGELWAGIELSVSRRRNEQQLKLALSILAVWPFDDVAAADFGVIFAHLRRTGQPIPRIDIQIAAIVRTMGNCVLVTKDSDFAAVPGLVVENWAI